MSYYQKHIKNASLESTQNQQILSRSIQANQGQSNVQKSKKNQIKQKGSENLHDYITRPVLPRQSDESTLIQTNIRHNKASKREDSKFNSAKGENNIINTKNKHQKKQGQSMAKGFQNLMLETDNSMQELLNSSINQFERYLGDREHIEEENHQLILQNLNLKNSLDQLKSILKQKLDCALAKQKQDFTLMIGGYANLINKLLEDKEKLTIVVEQQEQESKNHKIEIQYLEKQHNEDKTKIQELTHQKDQHVSKTKKQIDDFLQIIEQYEEEAEQQGRQNQQMKLKIEELSSKIKKYQEESQGSYSKCGRQTTKTQTLIDLLEQSQQQCRILREALRKAKSYDCRYSEQELQAKLIQVEQKNQQQFIEYYKAVKETMNKKDQHIQKLNNIIKGLKMRKCKTQKLQETIQMIQQSFN